MEAVKSAGAKAPSSEPKNAVPAPPEAPKAVADMAPEERQAKCWEALQSVLDTYRCAIRTRLTTRTVGDPSMPAEAIVGAEYLLLPLK